jgi:hypothetical protein
VDEIDDVVAKSLSNKTLKDLSDVNSSPVLASEKHSI